MLEPTVPATLEAALREAHSLPMLGRHKRRLIQLLASMSVHVARHPSALVEEQLLAINGRLATEDRREDAVRQLMEAARLASARGAGLLSARHRLAAVYALAREGRLDAARARLRELALAAEGRPELADAWHLAAAACGHGAPRSHLEQALEVLHAPTDDHLRYDVLVRLFQIHLEGGDPQRARDMLVAAGEIARASDDGPAAVHVDAMLGNLLVEAALHEEARAVLRRCVEAAEARSDDLTVLSEGTILAALLIMAEQWAELVDLARRLLTAAERRGNWLGIADAAMSWSQGLIGQDDVEGGILVLVRVGSLLQQRGASAAVNLIKARLGELRANLGPETVDALLSPR